MTSVNDPLPEKYLTPENVLRLYAEGRRNFRGAQVAIKWAPARHGRGDEMKPAHVHSPDGQWLDRADLKGADLSGADFRNARFVKGDFHRANFTGADMRGVNLGTSRFNDAIMVDVDFSLWGYENWTHIGNSFIRADLRGADFRDTNIAGANFRDADLRGAKFDTVNGVHTISWRGTDLRGATAWRVMIAGLLAEGADVIGMIEVPMPPLGATYPRDDEW